MTLLALLTNTQEDCTLVAAVDLAVSQELPVVASLSRWHTQRLMSLDCWFLALMMVRLLCLDSWASLLYIGAHFELRGRRGWDRCDHVFTVQWHTLLSCV